MIDFRTVAARRKQRHRGDDIRRSQSNQRSHRTAHRMTDKMNLADAAACKVLGDGAGHFSGSFEAGRVQRATVTGKVVGKRMQFTRKGVLHIRPHMGARAEAVQKDDGSALALPFFDCKQCFGRHGVQCRSLLSGSGAAGSVFAEQPIGRRNHGLE